MTLKVSDARRDVILAQGVYQSFPRRRLPHPVSFYFAQKVGGEGPLAPPPARSLSVLGIRMFSSTQEKRSRPLMCDVCHR